MPDLRDGRRPPLDPFDFARELQDIEAAAAQDTREPNVLEPGCRNLQPVDPPGIDADIERQLQPEEHIFGRLSCLCSKRFDFQRVHARRIEHDVTDEKPERIPENACAGDADLGYIEHDIQPVDTEPPNQRPAYAAGRGFDRQHRQAFLHQPAAALIEPPEPDYAAGHARQSAATGPVQMFAAAASEVGPERNMNTESVGRITRERHRHIEADRAEWRIPAKSGSHARLQTHIVVVVEGIAGVDKCRY